MTRNLNPSNFSLCGDLCGYLVTTATTRQRFRFVIYQLSHTGKSLVDCDFTVGLRKGPRKRASARESLAVAR